VRPPLGWRTKAPPSSGVDVVGHCVGEAQVHREDRAEDVYAAIQGPGIVMVIVIVIVMVMVIVIVIVIVIVMVIVDGEEVPLGAGRFIAVTPGSA
jgi:hypothetical protein